MFSFQPSLTQNYLPLSRLNFSSVFPQNPPPTSVSISCSVLSTGTPDPESKPKPKPKPKQRTEKPQISSNENEAFRATIPKKPRRGRRSEAAAVEDFVRGSLDRTFAAIRERDPKAFDEMVVMKERVVDAKEEETEEEKEDMVVEEDDPDWPVDTDVGWGIRASEFFEKHPIRNVVDEETGIEIDWEGEIDDNWVHEINCLEWETFSFHPSPLVVLIFERYHRASDNWNTLKELEKAIKVYWNSKDRLPPRAVKVDINIEKDLAYALKAKECPQILFLRGNRILYREKNFRTADELVQMIAHFYYKAKRPSCIDAAAVSPRY